MVIMPKIFDEREKGIKIPPVTMPEILLSIMDDFCREKGYKRNEFIRLAIREYLKKEGWLK
jgi:metal-responsive CopG/Arc/MetJ family transcriptional regulator